MDFPFYFSKKAIQRKVDQAITEKSYTLPYGISEPGQPTFYTFMQQILGGSMSSKVVETQTVTGQMQAYAVCPIVAGSIGKRNDALRNGRWMLTDLEGNVLDKTSFVLAKLMLSPNPLQTWSELISQIYAFRDIFGITYCLPVTPSMMGKQYTGALWVIPNWLVKPNYTGKQFYQSQLTEIIKSYSIAGFNEAIPADQMIVFRDSPLNVATQTTDDIVSRSRLYTLGSQVSNIQTSYEARRTLMEKKGPVGAWVNDNPKDAAGQNPMTPTAKADLQSEFQKYGLNRDQFQYVISMANVKWVQAGSVTKDLMLFEEIKDSAQVIYDAYGIPPFLTAWADQTKYTNLNEAKKDFYSGITIPDAAAIAGVFNSFFEAEKANIKLQCFFDHLEIFQKSRLDEATALKAMNEALNIPYSGNVITRTEFRALMSDFLPSDIFDPENIDGDDFNNTLTNGTAAADTGATAPGINA